MPRTTDSESGLGTQGSQQQVRLLPGTPLDNMIMVPLTHSSIKIVR